MTLLVLTCKIVGTTSWFHSKASLWVWYGCVANGNAVNRSKMYARSSRTSWNQRAVLFKQEPMQEVLLLISGMSYMRNTTPRISSENRHHEHQKNIKAKRQQKVYTGLRTPRLNMLTFQNDQPDTFSWDTQIIRCGEIGLITHSDNLQVPWLY